MTETFKKDSGGNIYMIKSPVEVLDYTIDWTEYLKERGDTILTVSFSVFDATTVSTSYTPETATIFISGGVIGISAKVTCTVTTSANITASRSFNIHIKDR